MGGVGTPGTYVLLAMGNRTLVVPQSDVRTLEPVLDLVVDDPPRFGVGWVHLEGQAVPVYCLNEALDPLRRLPGERRVCVLLNLPDGQGFGVVCDRVQAVAERALRRYRLPVAMARAASPVRSLALHEGHVALETRSTALARYLEVAS